MIRKKKKRLLSVKKRVGKLISVCILIALIGLTGALIARFVHNYKWEPGQITSKNFYFTVDLLGDTEMIPVAENQSEHYSFGSDTEGTWQLYGGAEHNITIHVQNYYDSLRINEKDITYTVSSSVNPPSGSSYNGSIILSSTNGTLEHDKASTDAITMTIPAYTTSPYEDKTNVQVEIKSTKPYTKIIKLNFELYQANADLRYRVIDSVGSPYAELVLMTYASSEITPDITWPNGLSIDNTNPLTYKADESGNGFTQQHIYNITADYQTTISRALNPGESETIKFFKDDISKNYSVSDKVVTQENGTYKIDLIDAMGSK